MCFSFKSIGDIESYFNSYKAKVSNRTEMQFAKVIKGSGGPWTLLISLYGDMKEQSSNGSSKTDLARQLGKEGEQAAGIVNAKKRIPSLSSKAKYRVPDELLYDDKILREIKNVKSQSYTQQLKDFNDWAKQNGYKFILEVRDGAEISGPLQEAINKGEVILKNIGE